MPPTLFTLPKPEVDAQLIQKAEQFWAAYDREKAEEAAGKNEPNSAAETHSTEPGLDRSPDADI